MPARKTLAASYEEKVVRSLDGCYGWTGAINHNGYAVFESECTPKRAHVHAWEVEHGCPVPPGMKVLHTCDNRACSRPSHLSVGTQRQNMEDMVAKGRQARGEMKRAQAKLTDAFVREIRARYRPKVVSQSMLAREFGVSRELIREIVRGRRWRHVDPA